MRALTAAGASLLAVASTARAEPTKEQCIAVDTHAQELRIAGKLHDALTQLDLCTNPACPVMISGDCSQRIEEIKRAMPTVVFDVKTSSGTDVAETRVEMDGRVLQERLDGRAVGVDPGEHTIVLTARGTTKTLRVLVHEGEKDRAVGMVLADPVATHLVPPSRTQRTAGLVVGATGLATLALGAVFGGVTIADHATVASSCPNNVCPSSDALLRVAGANADAQSFALASTISFVAGVVLAAVGVTLVVTSPSRARVVVGLNGIAGAF